MEITFDPKLNVAYIRLRKKADTVSSLKLSEELIVDMGSDGKVYGLELLNAREQLADGDLIELLLTNSATGAKDSIRIPH